MNLLRRAIGRLARAWIRLAYPDYEVQQKHLAATTRLVKRIDEQIREQAIRQRTDLSALARTVSKLAPSKDLHALERQVTNLGQRLDRHARVTATMLRRGNARSEPSREERRVRQKLERIAASQRTILVGPWTGEVGFELLYWIPFVHWFAREFDVDPRRLVVLSRGGTSAWYSHVTSRYIDAFSYVTTDEFRDATNITKKQRKLTAFDVALVRQVVSANHLGRVHVLHPEAMYGLFLQFWKEAVSVKRVEQYALHVPLGGDDAADVPPGLPASYVAVRFYFSNCFPDTPANRAFVAQVIQALSTESDVVLLNTPFTIDDHVDHAVDLGPRVRTLGAMTPARNLAIQTAVIRRARAFVGTYGGYSYLAPFCGVPSVAFYSTDEFFRHHLDLAQRVIENLGGPSLVVLNTRDADLLRTALPSTGTVR